MVQGQTSRTLVSAPRSNMRFHIRSSSGSVRKRYDALENLRYVKIIARNFPVPVSASHPCVANNVFDRPPLF